MTMNTNEGADRVVLVVNCGSTTIKFQAIRTASRVSIVSGGVDRIGRSDCRGYIRQEGLDGKRGEKQEEALPSATHGGALAWMFKVLPKGMPLHALGHRVVHGGSYFSEAAPANEDTLRKIEECIPLAPLHNPVELAGIRECMALHPEVPHFVSFDTAFHQNKPELTATFPLPKEMRETYGYRKFGFHGASHRYVAQRAAALMGKALGELKLVTCHLGGGSSITAVKGGIAWDTTATFGTCTGMPMGTRSGDIDLGVVLDLLTSKGKSAQEVSDLVYKESGLLALSGASADMAELERLEEQGHEGARLARDYYAYTLKRFIGSFAAAMDGLDGIVFTAGIGENDGALREKVCRDLAWLGVRFDAEKNKLRGAETLISGADSAVAVLVIPTNEELAIALEVAELLDRGRATVHS